MPESTAPVFSRLYLPSPLDPQQVAGFFTRMAAAATRRAAAVILETRATSEGIIQLLGAPVDEIQAVRRQLASYLPGSQLTGLGGYDRTTAYVAKKLFVDTRGLPLSVSDPQRATHAIYTALSRRLKPDELLVLQLVIGRAHSPESVPIKVPDPRRRPLLQNLITGTPEAPHEVRAALRARAAEHRFEVTIRVGVTADNADRRTRLGRELVAALQVAEAPSARFVAKPDDPNLLNRGAPTRWNPTGLSVSELVALCGWPLGDGNLPGLPPAHPKTLRADPGVETKQRLFAASLAPGDARIFGVSPRDALYHGIAVGATGSGKTTLLENLINADIASGAPVLVLDPKAQMPDRILASVPKSRWKDVVIIDATAENPIGFNPLDATGRDPDVVADAVLAVFKKTFADSWGPRTGDIFSASLRTLARAGQSAPEPYTLTDIVQLWTDQRFRTQLVGPLAKSGDIGLSSFWTWFEELSPNQRANVLASPMNKLRDILLRPAAVKILGQRQPAFRLRDIFRDKLVVLVPLNEGLIGPLTAELIGSLVIAEVWQATQERAREKGHEKNVGFVYVDEADRFMSSLTVSLPDALARSRSLSVAWFLAVQFWSQMPTDMRSAAMQNARTKVVFKQEAFDDARLFAQQAPELIAEDFMSLGLYEVYARMVSGGITSSWALARSLPPTPGPFDPAVVSAASYAHHQPLPPVTTNQVATANDADSALDDSTDETSTVPSVAPVASSSSAIGPVGRIKRQQGTKR